MRLRDEEPGLIGGWLVRLMLSARRVRSAEAERIGVSSVSEPGQVLSAARTPAELLLAKAPALAFHQSGRRFSG